LSGVGPAFITPDRIGDGDKSLAEKALADWGRRKNTKIAIMGRSFLSMF